MDYDLVGEHRKHMKTIFYFSMQFKCIILYLSMDNFSNNQLVLNLLLNHEKMHRNFFQILNCNLMNIEYNHLHLNLLSPGYHHRLRILFW